MPFLFSEVSDIESETFLKKAFAMRASQEISALILMNTCPWQFKVFLLLLLDLNFFKQN